MLRKIKEKLKEVNIERWFSLGFVIMLIIAFCSIIFVGFRIGDIKEEDLNYFQENYLQNVKVQKGTIESPSVIINVEMNEFLQILNEQTNPTVYKYMYNFYTFNEGLTIAYKLVLPYRSIWEERSW